jgi:hypothetical protein
MSSLWTLEFQTQDLDTSIARQLEIRRLPEVYITKTRGSASENPQLSATISAIFGNYMTNWMYSATLEMTQSTAPLPWTREDWSFLPVDLASVRTQAKTIADAAKNPNLGAYNVTVQTPALRARLDCRASDLDWINDLDFSNKTLWNSTSAPNNLTVGYELTNSIQTGYSLGKWIPFLPTPDFLHCCSNITTGQPGESVIGYWSSFYEEGPLTGDLIVAKIAIGKPLQKIYNDSTHIPSYFDNTGSHWIWPDKPEVQSVNCTPIIEQADAKVTVDLYSGTVTNYTLLGEPESMSAAWVDKFVERANSDLYSHEQQYVTVR